MILTASEHWATAYGWPFVPYFDVLNDGLYKRVPRTILERRDIRRWENLCQAYFYRGANILFGRGSGLKNIVLLISVLVTYLHPELYC